MANSPGRSEAGSSTVKYQGRKTSRAGSEQRRKLILEAALRIVVREGVRGIRHRAVAKEADVPLAATTYYFKDIQELINDTFTLYAEQALEVVNQFSMKLYEPMEAAGGKSLAEALNEVNGPSSLVNVIVEAMSDYVVDQVIKHRDALVAEQAFRYEAILNKNLHKLGEVHKQALMRKIIDLLTLIKSPHPEEDAAIVLAVINRVEYEGLLVEPEDLDKDKIQRILRRQLELMFLK